MDQAPHCVERLLSLGMAFDRNPDGSLATTLEAAHSRHRVLHVQDRTGRPCDVLRERVEADQDWSTAAGCGSHSLLKTTAAAVSRF